MSAPTTTRSTMSSGAPAPSDRNSLTIGPDGPILLHDVLGSVHEPVLTRAFDYWKSIDADIGRRIEEKVKAGAAPEPAEGMGEA